MPIPFTFCFRNSGVAAPVSYELRIRASGRKARMLSSFSFQIAVTYTFEPA